jgi:predicted MFS family arabinose efflux permease
VALLGVGFCYVYVFNFFQTWFHTFLVRGRGFSENGLLISALPFVVAGLANFSGGTVSDALVRRIGRTNGRRIVGVSALAAASLLTIVTMFMRRPLPTVLLLALVYGAVSFQQSAVFGVCLDIGRGHAGAVTGMMNTASQVGSLVGTVGYGYIVDHFHNYDAPFVPMAAVLFAGAALWTRIDAAEELA